METTPQYEIAPAHQIRPVLHVETTTYTPDIIDAQQVKLTELQAELDELKTAVANAKAMLNCMVESVSIPDADFRDWVFRMYWQSDTHATTLRKLVKTRLGDAHQVWKTIVEGAIDWPCEKCGAKTLRTFTSKTEYQSALKHHHYPFLCPSCQAQRDKETAAKQQETQARWEAANTRLVELRSMPYSEYLQTAEWANTRQQALKRAHYRCQLCNANNVQLHVHHKTYERLGTEYNSDLIVLCANCHAKFHDKEPSS